MHFHLRVGVLNSLHHDLEERPSGRHGVCGRGTHHGRVTRVCHDGKGLVVNCDAVLTSVEFGPTGVCQHLGRHELQDRRPCAHGTARCLVPASVDQELVVLAVEVTSNLLPPP